MRLSSPLGWLSDAVELRRLRRSLPNAHRAWSRASGKLRRSPMPSIWRDYAAWRANESSCVTRQNAASSRTYTFQVTDGVSAPPSRVVTVVVIVVVLYACTWS